MSSRNPAVSQSTSGFPDDSISPPGISLLQERGLSSPQQTPSIQRLRPVQLATFNLQLEAPPSPSPCLWCLSWLNLATSKNVEKLSFQPRLNCLYRQSKNFLTTPEFYISPPSSASWRSASSAHLPLFPSRPWQPARFGALQKMCEAFLSPLGVFVSLVGDPFPNPILHSAPSALCQNVPLKNVEKLSFGPHRLACTSRRKKYFSAFSCPILSHFQHFARFSRPAVFTPFSQPPRSRFLSFSLRFLMAPPGFFRSKNVESASEHL